MVFWKKYQPVKDEDLIKRASNLDIVKSLMKERSGTYRKTRETLPLEGGGNRVGVKGLTGIVRRFRKHFTDTKRYLWRHLRDRPLVTPHPDPLPQGERGDNF